MLYIHRNPKEYWLIVFNVSPAYIALLFMSTYIQFVIYKQQSFVLFVKSIPQLKSSFSIRSSGRRVTRTSAKKETPTKKKKVRTHLHICTYMENTQKRTRDVAEAID
jgi:short subunit dehydrogenase-like uncharacterized protein